MNDPILIACERLAWLRSEGVQPQDAYRIAGCHKNERGGWVGVFAGLVTQAYREQMRVVAATEVDASISGSNEALLLERKVAA